MAKRFSALARGFANRMGRVWDRRTMTQPLFYQHLTALGLRPGATVMVHC